MLEAFGQTDVGRRRKLNEDNFLVDPETNLYAVCDGMGGHNAGEVASKMAIETLARLHPQEPRRGEGHHLALRPGAEPLLRGQPAEDRHQAGQQAGLQGRGQPRGLHGHGHDAGGRARQRRHRSPWAPPATAAATWCAAGKLTQLTRDDSWVSAAWAEGILSSDEIDRHPLRNVITKAVGAKDDIELETSSSTRSPTGDVVLLCSDGLHAMINDEQILQAAAPRSRRRLEEAADAAHRRRQRGGRQGQRLRRAAALHGVAERPARPRRGDGRPSAATRSSTSWAKARWASSTAPATRASAAWWP